MTQVLQLERKSSTLQSCFFFTVEHFGGSSRPQRLEVDDEMVMHILLDMSFNQIFGRTEIF